MTLTITQDVLSHRNELYAKKGDKVKLITDSTYPVLLVNKDGNSFSVRYTGTNYEELKQQHESDNV